MIMRYSHSYQLTLLIRISSVGIMVFLVCLSMALASTVGAQQPSSQPRPSGVPRTEPVPRTERVPIEPGDRKAGIVPTERKEGSDKLKSEYPINLIYKPAASPASAVSLTANLFSAVNNSDAATTRFLLASGAEPNARNSIGQTPLIVAATAGDNAVIKVLVDHSADVNAKAETEVKDDSAMHEGIGYTPLMIAAWMAHGETVQLLLRSGADVNAKGRDGRTALIRSAFHGDIKIVNELLATKDGDVNAKDNDGTTALLGAAFNGHIEMVKALLQKDVDINAKDNSEATALMAAAGNGHFEIVRALISKGADIAAKNKEGRTALDFAEMNKHSEIVNILRPR